MEIDFTEIQPYSGCNLGIGSDRSFHLHTIDEDEAFSWTKGEKLGQLLRDAIALSSPEVVISYHGATVNDVFTIPVDQVKPSLRFTLHHKNCNFTEVLSMIDSSNLISEPELQICLDPTLSSTQLSLPIARIITEFLEYPERRSGLVRVQDQRQVAMTQASIIMTPRSNLIEAVTYKREDYVHPEDLEDLLRSLNDLEPDNPSSIIEVSFRADINHTNYRRFVNRYRRITDTFGNLFEVAENLDILEPAIAP
jgi:hypothetical protein